MSTTSTTKPWSIQDHITTLEQQAGFLEAALELAIAENDPGFFAVALGNVAKARGMTDVAEATGLTRDGLQEALSQSGDPRLSTLLGVIRALDVRLAVQPATLPQDERSAP